MEFNNDQKFGALSYSQHGEDFIFMNLCKQLDLKTPTYIDLGAYHPRCISNTYKLYLSGGHGVNVEANPFLIHEFHKERDRDINLQIAVDINYGRRTFYMEAEKSVLNSLEEKSLAFHNVNSKYVIEVKTQRVSHIITEYCDGKWPDFYLSDIEGIDCKVLCDADFINNPANRPKVICIECNTTEEAQLVSLYLEKHYFYLCKMGPNRIYVDRWQYNNCL